LYHNARIHERQDTWVITAVTDSTVNELEWLKFRSTDFSPSSHARLTAYLVGTGALSQPIRVPQRDDDHNLHSSDALPRFNYLTT
jgi:hypothetical protein